MAQASRPKTGRLRKEARMANKNTRRNENLKGYAFMAPWILGFLAFTLFPFLATLYLSFSSVRATILGYEITWTGLENYHTAFLKNTEFVPALGEFLSMVLPNTFVILVVSFIIAYLLGRIKKGRGLFRTIYFLPVIIMSGPVMSQILSSSTAITGAQRPADVTQLFIYQIINNYSRPLASVFTGVFENISTILWFTGIPIVLFINALQKINPSMYEAARIDAANEWQILWKITLPQLKPVAQVAAIFTIVQLGISDHSTVYTLINTATGNLSGGLGYAATYAWVYSLLVMAVIGLAFLILRQPKGGGRAYEE